MNNIYYKTSPFVLIASIFGFFLSGLASGPVLADGTETLGPPLNIVIASGTGIEAAGTGLLDQPTTINVDVPEQVKQALLYWECQMIDNNPGDDTISVNGSVITGDLIGGQTRFFNNAYSSTFRADITGLVDEGTNELEIDGLNCSRVNNGAGVMVIYDDGSTAAEIEMRDGNDLAFEGFSGLLKTTVPQTFDFSPSPVDRTATLSMFFSSVSGTASGFGFRPSNIKVTVGSETTDFNDRLDSHDGEEWDTVKLEIKIPADETTLTVQALSTDNPGGETGRPASFAWNAAGLSVPPPALEVLDGRMTGGGSIDGQPVTHGFEIHCNLAEPNNIQVNWGPRGRGPALNSNRFHLTELTDALCTEDPAIDQLPRPAPFDTFYGEGTGLYNGVAGATIEFEFVDAGEPGAFTDSARIIIRDVNGDIVLNISGLLDRGGNHQAHPNNK